MLASTAPHPIAVVPIVGASEIGLEGANWTDSGNLAGWNADASREDRKLELFGTEVPKDEITAIRSKLDRRADNTSSIGTPRPNCNRKESERLEGKLGIGELVVVRLIDPILDNETGIPSSILPPPARLRRFLLAESSHEP